MGVDIGQGRCLFGAKRQPVARRCRLSAFDGAHGPVCGLPIGLSFIGPKWHDHAVLKAGFAYEQLSKARVTPQFRATLESK